MLVSRSKVIQAIQDEIDQKTRNDRKAQDEIKEYLFKNHHIIKGRTQRLINNGFKDEEDDTILCLFLMAMYSTTLDYERSRRNRLDAARYFTDQEIATAIQADYSPKPKALT